LIEVSLGKVWNNQLFIVANADEISEVTAYIEMFIKEWNIEKSNYKISDSKIISNELWYSNS